MTSLLARVSSYESCLQFSTPTRSKAQFTPDFSRDHLRGGRDIDLHGSIGNLQRLELALEQVWVHEVPLAVRESAADQLLRAMQVNVMNAFRVVPFQVVPIVVFQCRAGQDDVLSLLARLLDAFPQRLQPGIAILIV